MESCRSLVACLNEGRNWRGTLVDVRADGRWGDPCSSGKDSDACGPYGRELVVFTHFPKAGGSAVGEKLAAALSAASPLAACHLLWNGLDRESTCTSIKTWVGRRTLRLAPTLPYGIAARNSNSSLVSAVPFRLCKLLWAQHLDFSLIAQIKSQHPSLIIRPVMFVRHPVDLFFSEYLYKRHCLWRQQGKSEPDLSSNRTLSQHIAQLRNSRERRMQLTWFLAGASWCSCAPSLHVHRARPTRELQTLARRNAANYLLIGTVERLDASMQLLSRLLGVSLVLPSKGGATARKNALDGCVSVRELPSGDTPSDQQRSVVSKLRQEDIDLYNELDHALARRIDAERE